MLSTRAHSFRQQAKLAIRLSWIGGYTNVVSLLATGWVCSHMSGTTTAFGKSIAEALSSAHGSQSIAGESAGSGGFAGTVGFYGFVLFCFWAGAFCSGLMTEWAHRVGRRSKYIVPISFEAWLLAVFSICMQIFHLRSAHGMLPQWQLFLMVGIAAGAMGLQNATITHISNAVVRTTHVTGVITDLGLGISHYLLWFRQRLAGSPSRGRRIKRLLAISRRRADAKNILLLAGLFASFLGGVALGALAFYYCASLCLWPPVAFLVFIFIQDRRKVLAQQQNGEHQSRERNTVTEAGGKV